MERKLKNWLTTFGEWSLSVSEAPESFHLWTGFFALASVLKRKVYIPKTLLGGWEVFPSMYVIFVAPPGKARKSTTAGYADDLLREIPGINLAPTTLTKEQLLKRLSEADDASISIFSSEFAMFVQKSGHDMYDILTDLFDSKKDVTSETITRGIEFSEKPCVNLLAATTPIWISSNLPEHVIGGGFASRVIFVFEERSRRYKMYYDDIDHEERDKLRDKLLEDLIHISTNVCGEVSLAADAKEFMSNWYEASQKEYEESAVENYRLEGYFQRKPAHIHKLAMLIRIAQEDSVEIQIEDFKAAIKLLEQLEAKLPQTFQNVGKNPFVLETERILEFIRKSANGTKRSDVVRAFWNSIPPQNLGDIIGTLLAMKAISVEEKDDEVIYKPKGL